MLVKCTYSAISLPKTVTGLQNLLSSSVKYSLLHSASAEEVECSCQFPPSGRNFMTRCQVLKDFLDISQVSFHKNIKINLLIL